MFVEGTLEFRRERLNLLGEVKKGYRGMVTADFGLERLRRHSLGKKEEKGYLRREK